MDEEFEYFLEKFGPAMHQHLVPIDVLNHYRGKLPDQLLKYWTEYGWCGYAKGRFWTVNPLEYQPVVEAWIGGTRFAEEDNYFVIARSATGKVLFMGERTGKSFEICAPDAVKLPGTKGQTDLDKNIRWFFGGMPKGWGDYPDQDGNRLFDRALLRLGRLNHDEMYGFVPALALGGPAKLEKLQKVKAVEHLVMLAQLSPLRELSFG